MTYESEEKKKGCNGRRKKRQEIVDHPIILELYIYGDHEDMWSSPREIPQSFTLCGKEYIFCIPVLLLFYKIDFVQIEISLRSVALVDVDHFIYLSWGFASQSTPVAQNHFPSFCHCVTT